MTTCSNCGNENPEGSRFCANCGASLVTTGRAGGSLPAATGGDRSQLPPSSPEWRMSDAGPLPPPPRRPRWLWFLLGILGLCLVICVGLVVWANTIGADVVQEFFSTAEASLTATAVSGSPAIATPSAGGSPFPNGTPVAIGTPVGD